jgi:hypothetical protein
MPDTNTTTVDELLGDDDDDSHPFLESALANTKVSTPCCTFCCSLNHEVSHCLRLLNLNKGLEFIADHPDVVTLVKKNQASFLTCLAPLYGNFISSATKSTLCKKPHVHPSKAPTSKSAFKASTLSILDNTDEEVHGESCNPDDNILKIEGNQGSLIGVDLDADPFYAQLMSLSTAIVSSASLLFLLCHHTTPRHHLSMFYLSPYPPSFLQWLSPISKTLLQHFILHPLFQRRFFSQVSLQLRSPLLTPRPSMHILTMVPM